LSRLHLLRNLQVDLYSWHKLVLASNSSELERVGELVRKSSLPLVATFIDVS
jgi:hypothetical protein